MEPGNECGIRWSWGIHVKGDNDFFLSAAAFSGAEEPKGAERPERKNDSLAIAEGRPPPPPGRCTVWARAREWSGSAAGPRGLVHGSPLARVLRKVDRRRPLAEKT